MAPATPPVEDAVPRSPQTLAAGTPKAQAIPELITAMIKRQDIAVNKAKLDEELELIQRSRESDVSRQEDTNNDEALEQIQVCVVGDRGVGKRELLRSFMGADYPAHRDPCK